MKRRKKPFIILAVIFVVVLLVAGYIKFFNGRLIYLDSRTEDNLYMRGRYYHV